MATILVVDDVPTNLRLMAAILMHDGHHVVQAADALAGLESVRQHRPDLIVSDVLMPGIDGFEFVRRLRADPAFRHIPVIFHTAHYLDEQARLLASACNVEHILPKPCEQSRLLETIGQALGSTGRIPDMRDSELFDREHRQLVGAKLMEKVAELEREIEVRRRAEDQVRHLNRVYAVLSGINSLIVRAKNADELCRDACRFSCGPRTIPCVDSQTGRGR